MFGIINTLLILPIIYVWARFLYLAAGPLSHGMPLSVAVTEFFYPTLVVTPYVCLLIFFGIRHRLNGFRVGGIMAAVFFLFGGPGLTFPVRWLLREGFSYGIIHSYRSPTMWAWCANFLLLIILLSLPAVKKAFAAVAGAGSVTRFANKVCVTSYFLFIGLMSLLQVFYRQPHAKIWIWVLGLFLLVALLSGGWLSTKSWDMAAFPVFERVALFFILLMVICAWTMLTLRHGSGGQNIRPNFYFVFMAAGIQSGVVGSFFDIVRDKGNDIKALVRYCAVGMVFVALFLVLQHFDHLEHRDWSGISAYDAPAKMRYLPRGKWFDAGTQQFGGWGATFLVLPYFCGHLAYAFTISLMTYTGWRFWRNREEGTAPVK